MACRDACQPLESVVQRAVLFWGVPPGPAFVLSSNDQETLLTQLQSPEAEAGVAIGSLILSRKTHDLLLADQSSNCWLGGGPSLGPR